MTKDTNNYMTVDESDVVMLLGQIYDTIVECPDSKIAADNLAAVGITVTDNHHDHFSFVFYSGRLHCAIDFTGFYDGERWRYNLRRYDKYRTVYKDKQIAREEIIEYLILITNAISVCSTLHKPDSTLNYTVTLNPRSLDYKPSIIIKDNDKHIVATCTIRSLMKATNYNSVDFNGDINDDVKRQVFQWANSVHPIAHVMWKTVADIVWETACLNNIKRCKFNIR